MPNRIVTISMPEQMYRILGQKVERGIYGSVSEYVRALVRRDLEPEIARGSVGTDPRSAHAHAVNEMNRRS